MNKTSGQFCVLCATDNHYVPYCGIMITSLFENNQDINILVYVIIDSTFPKKAQRQFERLANKYRQDVEFVIVDKTRFTDFPSRGMDYWSIAMYYRLLAAELLPESVDRVLYLDCDIIVTGSIKELKDMSMENYSLGAVEDICSIDKEYNQRLQYPYTYSYFNSGVLLINLKYWRDNEIQRKCLEYLFSNYDKLSANDQDVLNAVLYDKTIFLPLSFNFQVQFLKQSIFMQYPWSKKQQIQEMKKPLVIHYAMPVKPWDIQYYKMPFGDIWNYYKKLSQWRYRLPVSPKHARFKCIVKRYVLWPLGIMYNWPGKDFFGNDSE